jgi:hypothetical protein
MTMGPSWVGHPDLWWGGRSANTEVSPLRPSASGRDDGNWVATRVGWYVAELVAGGFAEVVAVVVAA